ELAKVDVRAGSTMGRIYRIYPEDRPPRAAPRLDKMNVEQLVAALDTPNGWQRDMATELLADSVKLQEWDLVGRLLEQLLRKGVHPEARAQALIVFQRLTLDLPSRDGLLAAVAAVHPGVRRQAPPLWARSLRFFSKEFVIASADDADAQVRLELAYMLGGASEPSGAPAAALARLATRHADDPYLVAAVLSSVNKENVKEFAGAVLSEKAKSPSALRQKTLGLVAAMGDDVLRVASRAIT